MKYIGTIVKQSDSPLLQYIDNQKEHHGKKGFQEEYRELLDKYKIAYNET